MDEWGTFGDMPRLVSPNPGRVRRLEVPYKGERRDCQKNQREILLLVLVVRANHRRISDGALHWDGRFPVARAREWGPEQRQNSEVRQQHRHVLRWHIRG